MIIGCEKREDRIGPAMTLLVDPRWQSAFLQLGLRTSSDVLAVFGGGPAAGSAGVIVQPHSLTLPSGEIVPVFFKQYCFPRASWLFWLRTSKARREFENYAVFERLGIRCAQRIACGEERDRLGRLRHAFILTRTVPNAVTLLDYFGGPEPAGARSCAPDARAAFRRQLADMTRRIHAASFYHNDLYWRNVLIEGSPGERPLLCWIDCPRGSFARWFLGRHRRIKDLAALDRCAAKYCSRVERMRFIKDYLGRARLDEDGKRLIRKILAYRSRRWHG
jgi:hypothetical protein